MDTRQTALDGWLKNHFGTRNFEMNALAGDASFRRYYRVVALKGSYVAMDAPPATENCIPFVAISKALQQLGLHTPAIYAQDIKQGFLLLSDFGDKLFLKELNLINAESLYTLALNSLAILRTCQSTAEWDLPVFTADFMRNELELFKEWFLLKHLKISLTKELEQQLNACFDFLVKEAANQPHVFMHRDYHSANLMVLPDHQLGILDFQDAFKGPITYDLVSLLRDCYVSWPDTLVYQWVLQYWEQLGLKEVGFEQFMQWFDLMGLQRHMKALLTFSRKWHRDGNPNYLQHIPRTVGYIIEASGKYSECKHLHAFFVERVGVNPAS